MGGGGRDQQQEVGGREQTSEHFGTSSNHLQLLLSGWWKRVNNRTFWDQLQSSSTAFVRLVGQSIIQNFERPLTKPAVVSQRSE